MRWHASGAPPLVAEDALRERCATAVAGLYEIEAEIGRGGMAVVYRARDTRLRRKVALKVLPPELAFRQEVKSRFLREAEMSARLSHPHIVPIYSVDESDGLVYFAMGLVEGESLASRLAREPRPPVEYVRRILTEVADALHYAHQHGVVHRDIKPDNILLDGASGRAVVTDFGIARAAEGDQRLTVTGIAVGTPAYMSPEQAMGEREVDGRADIYALGIVGYQMLAGELPFQATNTPAMLMKHLSERPRPLAQLRPDLPQNLVQAIDRALAKGRDERWADAAAFAAAVAVDAPIVALAASRPTPRHSHPATVGTIKGHRSEEIDAIERLQRDTPLPAPPFPPLPRDWMFDPTTREHGREVLRRWRDEQRRWRDQVRVGASAGPPLALREAAVAMQEYELARRTPEERIAGVRRRIVGTVGTVGFLAVINLMFSPQFPWVIFPALGMSLGIFKRLSDLWADGIPLRAVFRRPDRSAGLSSGAPAPRLSSGALASTATAVERLLDNVPREILQGPHGSKLRDAFAAHAQIRAVLERLPESEKALLPDIAPTVESLVERVRTLAGALHSLDSETSPDVVVKLRARVAEVEALPADAPERERRLELLQRQERTLGELGERRSALAHQLENALLVLESMKLDLMRLRSSGLESRLADSGAGTQEMRAIARDVQRAADAMEETRKEF
ncbi:MAG: protein kinase domain-containing protein [Gemmatimonadaceae bacterium]